MMSFDVVAARLPALPFDHARPRARLQRAGVARRVALVEPELVEVVVGGDVAIRVELLVGDAERALLEVLELLGGWILGQRRRGAIKDRPSGTGGDGHGRGAGHLQEFTPPHVPRLRCDLGFANIGRLLDQHGDLNSGSREPGTRQPGVGNRLRNREPAVGNREPAIRNRQPGAGRRQPGPERQPADGKPGTGNRESVPKTQARRRSYQRASRSGSVPT